MELKKTPKADLENKRNIFVQLGLVISLGIVFTAFNINDSVKSADTLGELTVQAIEDEVIPITRQETPPPPPPPPPPKVVEILTIIDDDVELDEEFEFESTEADDATIIDAVPVITEEEPEEDTEVFVIVEDMPEFPGGELALRQWISNNVKYPVIAAENGVQGKVYVTFVVDRDGSVTNARIARGVDPSLDQEALRVVNNLPKWKPGKQRGKPVRVSYTVPINFQLQ
ncbi:MAG TPA: energy transducer TonB [Prolixibacteraceae bacterium]|nr:energy transducer TonB [Prolixibacteraceae bacterium]HPR59702.1 energy transducer TonB [Prolixibacteraceae bacterium]